jgi:hypothetical protein
MWHLDLLVQFKYIIKLTCRLLVAIPKKLPLLSLGHANDDADSDSFFSRFSTGNPSQLHLTSDIPPP